MLEMHSISSKPNPEGFGTIMSVVVKSDKEPHMYEVTALAGYPTIGYGCERSKKSPVGDHMWIIEWIRSNTCE